MMMTIAITITITVTILMMEDHDCGAHVAEHPTSNLRHRFDSC